MEQNKKKEQNKKDYVHFNIFFTKVIIYFIFSKFILKYFFTSTLALIL
jgi:hypothetical protein